MLFALNYSLRAAKLVSSGQIKVDLFKCPDWENVIVEALGHSRVYVHFRYQAGRGEIAQADFPATHRWLKETDTLFVNSHFSPLAERVGNPPDTELGIRLALEDLGILAAEFGLDRVTVENIPSLSIFPQFSTMVSSTAAISRVIRESGAGLLLDTAHARLAAEDMGIKTEDYIMQLPVDRLCEVHVTGLGPHPKGGRIDHKPMTDEDWRLFDWTLARIRAGDMARPALVTFEYGGVGEPYESGTDEQVLLEQVPRMYEAVKSLPL